MQIIVGARASKLSRMQVAEILCELRIHHPEITFFPKLVESTGDKDQKSSLLDMDKTDFFTREIDQMLLNSECEIAIHSAKDLPDPLPAGLAIAAITRGEDPSDSLVMREGETIESLPQGAKIGTSSKRRIEMLTKLRCDLQSCDIRGTIEKRLELLEKKAVDGLIIARAALNRLQLNPNQIKLPGETAPLQGRLAILIRTENHKMKKVLECLNCSI